MRCESGPWRMGPSLPVPGRDASSSAPSWPQRGVFCAPKPLALVVNLVLASCSRASCRDTLSVWTCRQRWVWRLRGPGWRRPELEVQGPGPTGRVPARSHFRSALGGHPIRLVPLLARWQAVKWVREVPPGRGGHLESLVHPRQPLLVPWLLAVAHRTLGRCRFVDATSIDGLIESAVELAKVRRVWTALTRSTNLVDIVV